MFESLFQILQEIHPALFIAALCLLPLGPFPVSPIWILAGLRFGPSNAIFISFVCLLINFSLAYLLSAMFIRGIIERILRKRIGRLPQINESSQLSFTIMVRLIPGTPFAMQNYLLGFLRINPLTYFSIGIPIQMLYAMGFVVFGQSLVSGKSGFLIMACSLLLVIMIGFKILTKKLKSKNMFQDAYLFKQ